MSLSPELFAFLLEMATSLSGYPALKPDRIPTVIALPEKAIIEEVCPTDPQNCRGLAAFFHTETRRIVYRDTFDMENDTDNSFLVHELVHALQFEVRGSALFETCPAAREAEREAYEIQNRYLKRQGQFARFGEGLRFWVCPEDRSGD
ncbi:MAG: hypothetical protein NDJ89_06850 [Oligoflexia bacterium]|nr:hypothetical protein [Oligoflexia bacterium]